MTVFLSYAQADAKMAKLWREKLTAAGFELWDAENDLAPGANLHLEIGKALEQSDSMVVLLSPSAMKSHFVRSDITHALTSLKFQDRLVAVLLKPTPDVPWILQQLQFIDATKDKEEAARRVIDALRVASLKPAAVRRRRVHA